MKECCEKARLTVLRMNRNLSVPFLSDYAYDQFLEKEEAARNHMGACPNKDEKPVRRLSVKELRYKAGVAWMNGEKEKAQMLEQAAIERQERQPGKVGGWYPNCGLPFQRKAQRKEFSLLGITNGRKVGGKGRRND